MVDADHHTQIVVSDADAELRLDLLLVARLSDVSRSQVQRLIRDGCVTIGGRTAKSSLLVDAGMVIDVRFPAVAKAEPGAEPLPLTILHDDEDIAVVDKPAGMVVHPAVGHASGTMVNALLHHVTGLSGVGGRERPGVVHRLDKGTSGVIVIAKHDRAHRALSRQFHDRHVQKEYLALVWGHPTRGRTLDQPLGRDPRNRKKFSSRANHARPAVTVLTDVERLDGVSLVRVQIHTGRTHQIRVHLSEAGYPVVGDELYGGVRKDVPAGLAATKRLDRPFLHASRLAFAHPTTGEQVAFEAEMPADLKAVLATLRRASRRHDVHLTKD
ncbi:MAG: RluA family pseudouridine synthase [Acidobacteriota bacterium]